MFEEYFVTCDVAVALKGAGFDEPCMASWEHYKFDGSLTAFPQEDKLHIHYSNFPTSPDSYNDTIKAAMLARPGLFVEKRKNSEFQPWLYAAPLYEQVLDWFLSKGLYLHPYRVPSLSVRPAQFQWGVAIFDNGHNHLWPAIPTDNDYFDNIKQFLADGRRLALNNAILAGLKLMPE